ncbi:metallophosphoesterase [Bacillota bacterium LX-D]|nr:metallophosphoesterase [Bacillota bacterium LX-D]
MAIYALADLHLSFSQDKPMNIFGEKWQKHYEKIKANWQESVQENDTVLLCGDHSWGLKLEEAIPDLRFIGMLPGHKILIKGNHDLWWQSLKKMKEVMPRNISILQNIHLEVENYYICGTRGWTCPNDDNFSSHDLKIYERELLRLKNSLLSAKKAGNKDIIVMLHYPPFNNHQEPSGFVKLMEEFEVKICVYGHLHSDAQKYAFNGTWNHMDFKLVSCDYVNFKPVKLA